MDIISGSIFALWGAAVGTGLMAALAVLRLRRQHPVLSAFLVVVSLTSISRFAAYLTGGAEGYAQMWAVSQVVILPITGGVVLEVFIAQAKLNTRFLATGIVIVGGLLLLGVGIVAATSGWFTAPGYPYHELERLTRGLEIVYLIVTVAAHYILRLVTPSGQPLGRPFSRNAFRGVYGLALLLAGSVLADIVRADDLYWLNAIAQYIGLGATLGAYWIFGEMDAAGERIPTPPRRITGEEAARDQEFINALIRSAAREIKRIIRDAFRLRHCY